jgi:hypothetical protein
MRRRYRASVPSPDTTVVFTHVPKSAGTSILHALERALEADGNGGFDSRLTGAFTDWSEAAPGLTAAMVGIEGGKTLPPNARLVAGHYSTATSRAAYPAGAHAIILREGRSRVLSLWSFWRGLSPEAFSAWGVWGGAIRASASGSLADFLRSPQVVHGIDNQSVRVLLADHPLVPPSQPIPRAHDVRLLRDAIKVLESYEFADVIENPSWVSNFSRWLGRPLDIARDNETPTLPDDLRLALDRELTDDVLDELDRLNRLDNQLWRHLARRTMPSADPDVVMDRAFIRTVAKHALLLAPGRRASS